MINRRRSARSTGRLFGGLTTSLVVHSTAVLFFGAMSTLNWVGASEPQPLLEQDMDVVSVSTKEWERNAATGPLPPPSDHSAKQHKEAADPPLPAGQVVDVAPGNDQRPADSKYLAEHDNRVANETRAREQTPFYARAMPKQTSLTPKEQQEEKLKGNQGTGTDDATKAEKAQLAEREIPKTLERPKVATLQRSEDGETNARGESAKSSGLSNRLQVRPGTLDEDNHPGSEGRAGTPDAPNLPNSSGAPGAAVGAAPNDFLNVPIGDGTFLNTREFKYAGFFNRVKQRVGEQWRPNDEIRRRDPRGHATSRRRITVVDVTLDDEGRVSDIQVSQSCGIDFLDQEAVAAFERAQPFPNPPTGLFDQDRHVRFRFGFHIDNDPGGQSPLFFGRSNRW
jgi:TonB family protein